MKIYNLYVTKNLRRDLRANVFMPERILWKHIRNQQLGYKFRRQHGIGKYVVDFYCAFLRLVVEIDGWVHGEESVARRDQIREHFLTSLGLHVKRYTAVQINSDLEWVLENLKNYCDELSGQLGRQPHPSRRDVGTTSP